MNALWFSQRPPTNKQALEIIGMGFGIAMLDECMELASCKMLSSMDALKTFKGLLALAKKTDAKAIFGEFPPILKWFMLAEIDDGIEIPLFESHSDGNKHIMWIQTGTLKISKN